MQRIRKIKARNSTILYFLVTRTTQCFLQQSQISDQKFNDMAGLKDLMCSYCTSDPANYVSTALLFDQQLRLNITFLPCPPGFQLKGDRDPPGCECHPVLAENNVKCRFINHTGYHIWNSPLWIDTVASNTRIYIAHYCPFDYCRSDEKIVDLRNHSSTQCASNRAGRLTSVWWLQGQLQPGCWVFPLHPLPQQQQPGTLQLQDSCL